jgi:hypothetical protein
MTEKDESDKAGFVESKFGRVSLFLFSMLLIFAGPTYVPYVLSSVLQLDSVASLLVGVALLVVGLLMMVYLIRKKVIT